MDEHLKEDLGVVERRRECVSVPSQAIRKVSLRQRITLFSETTEIPYLA